MELLYALSATFAISLLALAGIVLLPRMWSSRRELLAISFAAGVLLSTALLELLPEAIEQVDHPYLLAATLGGIVSFFFLERYFRGLHHHEHSHGKAHHDHGATESARYLVLLGDAVHNFVDGVTIAAGFLVSPSVGLATTLAVAAHELPHEVADYSILIRSGYSRRRALFFNFLSGLTAVLGALSVFALGDLVVEHAGWILATAAGMFLYIAAADLIPEIQHRGDTEHHRLGAAFLAGVVLIALLTVAIPHSHDEPGHQEGGQVQPETTPSKLQ